jgi:two-component system NarL family sensor kinase
MFLTKEEFILLIALSAGVPIFLIGYVSFLLLRQNNLRKQKQIEIRDAMLLTEEKERKRIAQDLHDQITPFIAGIKYEISFNTTTSQDKINFNIEKAKHDLTTLIGEIRSISHNLYSTKIINLGLIKSLQESLPSFGSANKEINVASNINEEKLSYQFKVNVYRICMELINNSMKHSNGEIINIRLDESGNYIYLEYKDNGNIDKKQSGDSIGIQSIRNRVNLLNGKIVNFTTTFEKGAYYFFEFLK